jgi:large subunit ribosomal protein L11
MSKEVVAKIKLEIVAGQASPAPPVGPALGQQGVNIMGFVREFNERTKKLDEGTVCPVLITVFKDKSFNFVVKTPPASYFLKKAAGVLKGSGEPNKNKVGKLTRKQVEDIARAKMEDLNTKDLQQAIRIIEGSARSMGLEIK